MTRLYRPLFATSNQKIVKNEKKARSFLVVGVIGLAPVFYSVAAAPPYAR
jgi:hypothetical protein